MYKWIIAASAAVFVARCANAQVAPELIVLHEFGRSGNAVTAPYTTLVEIKPGTFVGSYLQGLFKISSTGQFNLLADFHNAAFYGTVGGPLTPASNGLLYGGLMILTTNLVFITSRVLVRLSL